MKILKTGRRIAVFLAASCGMSGISHAQAVEPAPVRAVRAGQVIVPMAAFVVGVLVDSIKDYVSDVALAPSLRSIEDLIVGLLSREEAAGEEPCFYENVMHVRMPILSTKPVESDLASSKQCRKVMLLNFFLFPEKCPARYETRPVQSLRPHGRPVKKRRAYVTDTLIVPTVKKGIEAGSELVAKVISASPLALVAYTAGLKLRLIVAGIELCLEPLGPEETFEKMLPAFQAQMLSSTGAKAVASSIAQDSPVVRAMIGKMLEIIGLKAIAVPGIVEIEGRPARAGIVGAKAGGVLSGLGEKVAKEFRR